MKQSDCLVVFHDLEFVVCIYTESFDIFPPLYYFLKIYYIKRPGQHNWMMCRDSGMLIPKQDVFIKPSPQGAGIYADEEEERSEEPDMELTPRKQCLPVTAGLRHR